MASLSSPGIGSGLDVKSIVSQLVALERRPIDKLTADKSTTEAKLSAFGLVQSYTNNLRDASRLLALPGTWAKVKATSSDATSVAASATDSAAAGSYSVEVSQLARAQSLASPAFGSSATTFGAGTLTLQLGAWTSGAPPAFTAKSGASPQTVTVAAGDSLNTIRDSINAANAGVRASLVNDGSGVRLVIRSEDTGAVNAVKITASGDASLNDLAYSPDEASTGNLSQTLSALNATGTINGLAVSSPSNTLSEAVDGLTLTFAKETTSPVEVTVAQDKEAMRKAVDDFVKAYNDLNGYIAEQTKYDAEKKIAGKLQSDTATRSLHNQLKAALQITSGAASGLETLSAVGIELQSGGSLQVNTTRFNAALNDTATLTTAFTADNTGEANDGFAVRWSALTTSLTDAEGLLPSRAEGLRALVGRQTEQIAVLEDRVKRTEDRLMRQYSALDSRLSTLNALGSYVSQQVSAWSNSGK